MSIRQRLAASIAAGCAATGAFAGNEVTFIEDFSRGNDEGQWVFLTASGATFVEQRGGNLGAYLTHEQSTWPAPVIRTTYPASIFTGDYRALGVTSVALDMRITLAQAPQHPDYTMTIMLGYDNGTPDTIEDDTWAWFNSGEKIPWPGTGWTSYEFDIPSQLELPFGELPDGWEFFTQFVGPTLMNHTWRELMENVTHVWVLGANDPAAIGAFWNWITGVDNIRLTYIEPALPGDLNGDETVDVFDLLILLGAWGDCVDPEDCPADLNNDGEVDVLDLLALLSVWS